MSILYDTIQRIEKARDKSQKKLNLHGCIIGVNAPEIFSLIIELEHLEILDLSGTGIPLDFNPELEKLSKLTSLNISNNDLKKIPTWIRGLRNLTTLNLGRNMFTLPEWVGELKNLTSLTLSNLYLRSLPEKMAALARLTSLNLSNNELREVPVWIGELLNLTSLNLSHNYLSKLPDSVGQLRNLSLLNLANNYLSTLPKAVGKLQSMTSLDISNNQLSHLPEVIGELRNLTSLNLSHNRPLSYSSGFSNLPNLTSLDLSYSDLNDVPEWVKDLGNLTSLNLSNNRLSRLSGVFSELPNLTSLNLSHNYLSILPEWISRLRNLTSLNVSNNAYMSTLPEGMRRLHNLIEIKADNDEFSAFPEVIYELPSLRIVSFVNNNIKEISPKVLRLENLEQLILSDNPIIIPPPEIAKKDFKEIARYFRQLETEGLDHLYEAKVLVLGEGGAGKTSLAKKIENPDYQLHSDEDSTKGIDVITWNFTVDDQKQFRANIWDFGGQEIYHTTHQFFLTKRSLYLLVADTRKEDTDFYYWLNVVELLSDNSPLLIVKNEKQERRRDINERQLRGEFDNLKETLATNLATNRGLADVLARIKYHLIHLEHIGSPLPKTWLKVRSALESDSRNYIPTSEYFNICEQNGFGDSNDKIQLSGYLHDLGVCLHFQDDPLLKKIVILKPEWGTDAVYKVLDNSKVVNNLGKFDRSDLTHIWSEEKYQDMQDELLQLMINFKLCYRIPESDYYIAPQLLTENQPSYEWDENQNLLLRYSYEFMPKGIITQFIVIMHRLIAEGRLVWRSGVVLERENTRAEVIEHYGRREIRIRVRGQHRKEMMAVINYELEKIHDSYKRLKYRQLVPCSCRACKDKQEPHFFTLDTLRKYYGDRQETIQCQNSYEMVSVRSLIDEISERENALSEDESKSTAMIVNIFKSEVENFGIQQAVSRGNIMTHNNKAASSLRSPWISGSFYVFVFAAVMCGLGVLFNTVSLLALPILLIAGAIFVPLIGILQLKQDKHLSDKTFTELMKIIIGQLPLIGKFSKPKA